MQAISYISTRLAILEESIVGYIDYGIWLVSYFIESRNMNGRQSGPRRGIELKNKLQWWLKSSLAVQDTLVECEQMRSIFQHSFLLQPFDQCCSARVPSPKKLSFRWSKQSSNCDIGFQSSVLFMFGNTSQSDDGGPNQEKKERDQQVCSHTHQAIETLEHCSDKTGPLQLVFLSFSFRQPFVTASASRHSSVDGVALLVIV